VGREREVGCSTRAAMIVASTLVPLRTASPRAEMLRDFIEEHRPSPCSSSNGETCRQSFRPAPVPVEAALYDSPMLRAFVGIDLGHREVGQIEPMLEEVHPQHALHATGGRPLPA
jgi:hypothetical protein